MKISSVWLALLGLPAALAVIQDVSPADSNQASVVPAPGPLTTAAAATSDPTLPELLKSVLKEEVKVARSQRQKIKKREASSAITSAAASGLTSEVATTSVSHSDNAGRATATSTASASVTTTSNPAVYPSPIIIPTTFSGDSTASPLQVCTRKSRAGNAMSRAATSTAPTTSSSSSSSGNSGSIPDSVSGSTATQNDALALQVTSDAMNVAVVIGGIAAFLIL